MSIPTTPNNGGEDAYEWEEGPIEPVSRDQPSEEGLDEQLQSLEDNEGFEEPEIADEGISPTNQFEEPLEQALQTLEADEPFELQKQAPVALDPLSEPAAPDLGSIPEEADPLTPPGSLQELYAAGGRSDSGGTSLPGFPPVSNDGPIDSLKTFLDSGFSMNQLHTELLIDHGAQLDHLTESLGRARL
jgi:hypothetical protein